ncbi:MAG: ABC transporter permease [Gemmatimonadetes bacterium]|nr:ABC transporter permease [Gemmatimonadota bacterium]
MWKILLAQVLGHLRAHRTRTLLTIFAMVWGTISIVLLLAFGQGLRNQVSVGLLNAGERIFMVYGGQTSLEHEGLARGRRIRLREEDLDLVLRAIPEFEFGSPSYGRNRTHLEAGENQTTTYMEGVDPIFSELRRMFPAPGGRFINQRDIDQRRRVLFLGDDIAARLFGDTPPVGQTILLDGLSFRVIGVMESKFQDSSNNGPDENRAVIPASTFRSIYGNDFVNHLLVRPRNVADAPIAKRELYRVLGGRHRFDPSDERALGIWDFIEDEKIVGQIGFGIQVFLGLVGAFTLLVAGVGVANIMYVVVRERTQEIGIRLAVGARRRHIVNQFLFEAVLISVGGGLLGLAVASLLVFGIDSVPSDNPALEYIMNPKLSLPIASSCVGLLMAIGLVAGILPARKAARLDPVESLRYE